jgi:pimeloyl-ACP methyl ester carboxylesterase
VLRRFDAGPALDSVLLLRPMRADTNGVQLEFETFGNDADPTIVLIMGFSQQLTAWDAEFCKRLAARAFRVVRFDNRDAGLSTRVEGPRPNVMAIVGGDLSSVAYGLEAMADDTAGLIEWLGVESAHVVGASMGGMIAQTLAIRHPRLVKSLVSIMSTTGDRTVGHAKPETMGLIMTRSATQREEAIEQGVRVWHNLRSPGFTYDEGQGRIRIATAFDRGFNPEGTARQAGAIAAQVDRTADLAKLAIPVTVIHGAEDPLIDKSGGEATAKAIPGAKLIVVPGMGHDLPAAVWPLVIDAIAETAARAG